MSDIVFSSTWLFILGSLGGVLLELAWMRLVAGREAHDPRTGLLYLPFNPLYGVAAVVGSLVLAPFAGSPAVVFLLAVAVFTLLEWTASVVMERGFGVVFWDYRDKPLNLAGRVCLEYSLLWGLLGLALVYVLDPALLLIVGALPRPASDVAAVAVLVLVAAAAVLTLHGFTRLRSVIAGWTPAAEATASRSAWDRIVDRLAPPDVVAASFPEMNLSVRYRRLRLPARSARTGRRSS